MLPFLEHELYNKLLEEMRCIGIKYNAVFGIKCLMIIQEGALFAVISGTVCTLKALLVSFLVKLTIIAEILSFWLEKRCSEFSVFFHSEDRQRQHPKPFQFFSS